MYSISVLAMIFLKTWDDLSRCVKNREDELKKRKIITWLQSVFHKQAGVLFILRCVIPEKWDMISLSLQLKKKAWASSQTHIMSAQSILPKFKTEPGLLPYTSIPTHCPGIPSRSQSTHQTSPYPTMYSQVLLSWAFPKPRTLFMSLLSL